MKEEIKKLKPVSYEISEESYWKVGHNSNRLRMKKSDFIDLLIKEYSDKIKNNEK